MRPREVMNWVICEETGQQAINGACPSHHGDACLIAVGWVDNSHVRRDLAETQVRLWEAEAAARDLAAALHRFVDPDDIEGGMYTQARETLARYPSFSGEEGTGVGT